MAAVFRPFSSESETEPSARGDLEKKLAEADPPDELLDEAAARFEAADARPRWLGRALWAVLLFGAAAMLFWPPTLKREWETVRAAQILGGLVDSMFDAFETGSRKPVPKHEREAILRFLFPKATPEQTRILAAETAADAKTLWKEVFPDDPAFYYHYARKYLGERGELPPDFAETAARLDPGNGYADLLAAGVSARRVVRSDQTYHASSAGGASPGKRRPRYSVADEVKFNRCLELFSKAAAAEKLDSRHVEILRRCPAVLPESGEPSPSMVRMARSGWILSKVFESGDLVDILGVSRVLSARAAQLEAAGDKPGLARLAKQWLDFVPKGAKSSFTLLGTIIWRAAILSSGKQLSVSCHALGLEGEARRFDALVAAADKDPELDEELANEKIKSIALRAGFLGNQELPGLLRVTECSLEIDPMDLTADRLASHTLVEWVFAHLSVLVLMGLAGVSVMGWFRWGGVGRLMGKRIAWAATPGDWAWIVSLGVLAPLVWYGTVTRIPAFHARDIFWHVPQADQFLDDPSFLGMSETDWPLSLKFLMTMFVSNNIAVLQCLSALLLVAAATVQAVRWRVAVRGRVLGFRHGWPGALFGWSGPLAAALALPACSLPAIAFLSGASPEPRHLLPAAILLGYVVMWFLVLGGTAAFRRPARGLERAVTARMLVPAFLCAAIVLGIAGQFAAAEHRHWLSLDEFGIPSRENPGITKYEHHAITSIRRSIVDAFRD